MSQREEGRDIFSESDFTLHRIEIINDHIIQLFHLCFKIQINKFVNSTNSDPPIANELLLFKSTCKTLFFILHVQHSLLLYFCLQCTCKHTCECMFTVYLCVCSLIDFECSKDENYMVFILLSSVPISMSGVQLGICKPNLNC